MILQKIEIYFIAFFIFHFVLKFYISQQRILFLLELTTLVDISSIIMIIFSQTKFITDNVKYFFRLFRMVRILYLFKLEDLLQKRFNETVRNIFKLLIALTSLVFLSSAFIIEIENYNFR
jgi:hypothetical protein